MGATLPAPVYLVNGITTQGGDVFDAQNRRLSSLFTPGLDDCYLPIQPVGDAAIAVLPTPPGQTALTDQPLPAPGNRPESLIYVIINYDDINVPGINPRLQNAESITVGDLHGNTLTFLQILIQSGILTVSQADYQNMRQSILDACRNHALADWDYDAFVTAISRCQVNGGRTGGQPGSRTLRLIGDTVGDRVSNDSFTLLVIGHLKTQSVVPLNLVIIFSNHDSNLAKFLSQNPANMTTFRASAHPYDSLRRFIAFLNTGLRIGDPRATHLCNAITSYASCMKLYDWDLVSNGSNYDLFLFSHASFHPRISLEACKKILEGSPYYVPQRSLGDFTLGKLINLLDLTNAALNGILLNIATHWSDVYTGGAVFNPNNPDIVRYGELFDRSRTPAPNPCYPYLAIWMRLRNHHDIRSNFSWQFPLRHLSVPPNWLIRGVHGHDLLSRTSDLTLDNEVGKANLNGSHPLRVLLIN